MTYYEGLSWLKFGRFWNDPDLYINQYIAEKGDKYSSLATTDAEVGYLRRKSSYGRNTLHTFHFMK